MQSGLRIPVNRLGPPDSGVREAVAGVLDRGWYILGPEVSDFEAEFASYCGADHCVGVASGTDALEIALRAVGVSSDADVVVAPNAGGYATVATWAIGATPRYADVSRETHCVTRESVELAVSPETRAIVVTHLFGQIAPEIESIAAWASSRGVAVVEDCAQAAGAQLGGRMAGTFGDIGTYSFYPTKNLAAIGDAGALITSRSEIADRARALRQYGWASRYHMETAGGMNSRLDEVQAAVLRIRLPDLAQGNARRRQILARFGECLPADLGRFTRVTGPDHAAHLAVASLEADRERFREFLGERGVATDVHYPVLDFEQPSAEALESRDFDAESRCANARWLNARIVTVPCFPGMTDEEVDVVCSALVAAGGLL
jgi:dTDP-3-amino-2,3,6-trideoxy-4-keto-D-glucose/dTDP-3-amino-3,4,6-trideoxy-alpha-D-glucose/dTDP-2,6-dideoxy-D-kanosamine transaminase